MERELAKGFVALPILIPIFKKKEIKDIHMQITCFRIDEHTFIKDMETFLRPSGITCS